MEWYSKYKNTADGIVFMNEKGKLILIQRKNFPE
jgi:hypothetical protein